MRKYCVACGSGFSVSKIDAGSLKEIHSVCSDACLTLHEAQAFVPQGDTTLNTLLHLVDNYCAIKKILLKTENSLLPSTDQYIICSHLETASPGKISISMWRRNGNLNYEESASFHCTATGLTLAHQGFHSDYEIAEMTEILNSLLYQND